MHEHNHTHDHGHSHGSCDHGHHHHDHVHAGGQCCSSCGTEPRAMESQEHKHVSEKHEDTDDDDGPQSDCCEQACSETHSDSDGPSCACCGEHDVFSESAEVEAEEQDEFRKEIRFLSITGAIFALLLIFEGQIENIAGVYMTTALFVALYLTVGIPVLKDAFKLVTRFDLFNEFTLMSGATIAAIGIGEMSEAVGVMLFYRLGEAFQERAASQSRRSIKSLLAQKPMTARVVRDDIESSVNPQDIVKGDVVKVLPGETIPIDGTVISGSSQVDSSAMTGESIPISVGNGDTVRGGTLSLDGLLMIEATGPFQDSTIAKVLEMVQNAVARKSPTERFITKFSKWYTPTVFFIAAAVAVVPPLLGFGAFRDWLYKGLVMLVISCPCALVISIPLGYFGGIGAASKRGILVKGANVFDALSKVTTAVFDKTGTLTYGIFEVDAIVPANGVTKETLLEMAAQVEAASNHPIAKSIVRAAPGASLPKNATVTQVPGKGMLLENDGEVVAVGNAALLADLGVHIQETGTRGTLVYVSKNGEYQGFITVADKIREESASAIKELKEYGIGKTYMLTGDNEETAKNVAGELGIDAYRAALLPDGKVGALEEISAGNNEQTIFVGDGVNDGPVLVSAGVGVAMGGLGSQVAVEVADAVILDDSPRKVPELLKISKKTRTIVWQNIVLALGVKTLFMIFGVAGIAGLWEAVFADVGVALLAILNATRASRV